eukprot:5994638-Ditylum_brightwellii.AAC.1
MSLILFYLAAFSLTVGDNEETELSDTKDNDDELVEISLERTQTEQEERDDSNVVYNSENRK